MLRAELGDSVDFSSNIDSAAHADCAFEIELRNESLEQARVWRERAAGLLASFHRGSPEPLGDGDDEVLRPFSVPYGPAGGGSREQQTDRGRHLEGMRGDSGGDRPSAARSLFPTVPKTKTEQLQENYIRAQHASRRRVIQRAKGYLLAEREGLLSEQEENSQSPSVEDRLDAGEARSNPPEVVRPLSPDAGEHTTYRGLDLRLYKAERLSSLKTSLLLRDRLFEGGVGVDVGGDSSGGMEGFAAPRSFFGRPELEAPLVAMRNEAVQDLCSYLYHRPEARLRLPSG